MKKFTDDGYENSSLVGYPLRGLFIPQLFRSPKEQYIFPTATYQIDGAPMQKGGTGPLNRLMYCSWQRYGIRCRVL